MFSANRLIETFETTSTIRTEVIQLIKTNMQRDYNHAPRRGLRVIVEHSRHRLAAALTVLLCAPLLSEAAPKSELWPIWEAQDTASTESVDHTAWSDFLSKYVRKGDTGAIGVAYDEIGDDDRARLDEYLASLQATPVKSLARDEQLPFWINLYNATTVKVVLDAWPVDSIRDIKSGLFSGGPWSSQRLTVAGEKISLNDIEHRILRPIWRDPRLHYALNCASVGCPDLLATAFTRANADQLMDEAAHAFVNHPRAARVKDGKLVVSSIYHWFKEDFGGSDDGVLAHLRQYAGVDLTKSLESTSRVADHQYDWSINLVN